MRECVHRTADDHAQVDSNALQRQVTVAHSRDVEQIVDESCDLCDLTLDQSARLVVHHVLARASFQYMHGTTNDAQEIAELVREPRKDILCLSFRRPPTDVDCPRDLFFRTNCSRCVGAPLGLRSVDLVPKYHSRIPLPRPPAHAADDVEAVRRAAPDGRVNRYRSRF